MFEYEIIERINADGTKERCVIIPFEEYKNLLSDEAFGSGQNEAYRRCIDTIWSIASDYAKAVKRK